MLENTLPWALVDFFEISNTKSSYSTEMVPLDTDLLLKSPGRIRSTESLNEAQARVSLKSLSRANTGLC